MRLTGANATASQSKQERQHCMQMRLFPDSHMADTWRALCSWSSRRSLSALERPPDASALCWLASATSLTLCSCSCSSYLSTETIPCTLHSASHPASDPLLCVVFEHDWTELELAHSCVLHLLMPALSLTCWQWHAGAQKLQPAPGPGLHRAHASRPPAAPAPWHPSAPNSSAV